MKRYELQIEHMYKNKFVGVHTIGTHEDMFVLGQSRTANIRLLGDDVSQIHAMVEFRGDAWYLVDMGSQTGTWISKKPITSEPIKSETLVSIGGHTVKLTPKMIGSTLFAETNKMDANTGSKKFHQIIIRKSGMVMRTELLGATEPYTFVFESKETQLQPPTEGKWTEHEFGPWTVQQRLVASDDVRVTMSDRIKTLAMPEMRVPITVSLLLVLLIMGIFVALPNAPTEELAEVKKDSTFTKMIFDAKVLKKKRAEMQERRLVMKKSGNQNGGGGPGNDVNTTPVHSKGDTPKVVSKIKGLSTLLGKISKRASANSIQITAAGRSPTDAGAGRVNLAAVGSLQGVATQVGNGGEVFRVGGVGTVGKGGGGTGSLGALGSLSTGNAGNASVGVLDEETEIEGGLDRDVIARIIQNQLGEIRYCYERQLSAEPDLYGKVQVKFTIDGGGTVLDQRVGITTLKNAMVEGCILRRMARWKFPKPKGGTHVLVTYPFMFKSTN